MRTRGDKGSCSCKAEIQGSGSIAIDQLNSDSKQRDEHIIGADYFDAEQFPTAEFIADSFSGLPDKWIEDQAYPFTMNGKLTVRGIEKEVTFTGQALYTDNQIKLSSQTVVTFTDFGMVSPHSIVLSAENDVNVHLELVLR
ncbi:YceI family protein [Paenibacillus sp. GCM10012307]|uniref:YceI family protein n=1 Tax=Paenibacillus roseus TaxID=2798579 RepID=A0A934J552_9BACL|nr:YceI family protein [Paenibacillus roseus]MBJ6361864.1 YceI family protein [Paenibacillus roseus]